MIISEETKSLGKTFCNVMERKISINHRQKLFNLFISSLKEKVKNVSSCERVVCM